MADEFALRVQDLSKTFRLPHEKRTSIKSSFVNLFRAQTYEKQKVLNGISFEIKRGEFFGIVGRNGSGKSTLLKLMAGIYTPSKGTIKIKGSLTPFIELGVGFNPELTGRENVYLNGALLGFDRIQMRAMYDEIVDFAELGNFMDQKLKNYSSGMQVRLAFSIAIRAKGDILLLDEVLAVGDASFQKKCLDYFLRLKIEGKTVVLVTHDMAAVEKFCDRAMLLEGGTVKAIGSKDDIAEMYEEMFLNEEKSNLVKELANTNTIIKSSDRLNIEVETHQTGKLTEELVANEEFKLVLNVKAEETIDNVSVHFVIKNHQGQVIIAADTEDIGPLLKFKEGETKKIEFSLQNILTNGVYAINTSALQWLKNHTVQKSIFQKRKLSGFRVHGIKKYRNSLIHPVIRGKVQEK